MDRTDIATWQILVVDDEPDSIEVIRMVLEAVGSTVHQASNGVEGLKVFREVTPDVVLADLSMPDMDGWEFLKELRAIDNSDRKVPVVALTAHAMKGDKERVIAAGFDAYMSKPVSMRTLVDSLYEHVSNLLE